MYQSIEWRIVDDTDGILERSLENIDWVASLEDILTFLIYGNCVMEMTIKEDESDGKFVWNRLYYRPQTSITDFIYNEDTGDIVEYKQTVTHGEFATIPASNCLLFNIAKTQDNAKGKSLFRNAYRPWYYKTNIERLEAIGIERDLTGVPVLTAPAEADLHDEETGNLNKTGAWAWDIVKKIKYNNQEGLVLQDGWKFELVGSPGKRQHDLNQVSLRFSNEIALSMLSQFLVLGMTSSSGSFALAKEQKSLFNIAVEGFAVSIANVVNTQFIGTKSLQVFNNLEKQPKLIPVIDKLSAQELASTLGRLLKFNIIEPDDKLEEFLRDKMGLPEKDSTTTRIADVKLSAQGDK